MVLDGEKAVRFNDDGKACLVWDVLENEVVLFAEKEGEVLVLLQDDVCII